MAEYSIEELIAWCDKKAEKGHSLFIKWGGGGGDADIDFLIDEKECKAPQAKKLIDLMNEELGYGWWNGNGINSGEVKYNPKSHLFKGENSVIDFDFPEEIDLVFNFQLKIPKSYIFNEVCITFDNEEITLSLSSDSDEIIEEDKVLQKIKKELEVVILKEINNRFPDFYCLDNYEVDPIYRDQFKEEGDNLVYNIEEIPLSIIKYISEEISLDLKKILKKSKKTKK